MAAILNGMALIKVRSYGSGFLIFSDYARGAIRLGAIMEIARSFIFSRTTRSASEKMDRRISRSSISPRCARFPALIVLRPADANEVTESWRLIMGLHHRAGRAHSDQAGCADVGSWQVCSGIRLGSRRLHSGRESGTEGPT